MSLSVDEDTRNGRISRDDALGASIDELHSLTTSELFLIEPGVARYCNQSA